MTHKRQITRRWFILSGAALLVASPAQADFVNAVRTELQRQGFRQISVSSTLLGRSKIVARGQKGSREIIMNPKTGEILRDLYTSAGGATVPSIVGQETEDDDDGDDGDDGGKGRGRGRGGDDGDDGGDDNGGDDRGGDDRGGDGDGDSGGGDGDGGGDD